MTRVTASLALIAALTMSACGQPAKAPSPDTASDTAVTPVQSTAEMPADAPPQEEAVAVDEPMPAEDGGTCRASIGEAASARLVARCIAVSPATHPPCNALNPCEMIQGEIDRACGQYGPDETKPSECTA